MFSLQSCSDDFSTIEEIETSWQESTHLILTPVEGKEAFIWEKSIETSEQYWKNTSVEFDVVINSEIANTEVSKIDFYITAEERDGYNYTAPFDTDGKLVSTVSSISEDGKFSIELDAEEVYQLFSSDFKNDRTESQIIKGDLFELHWVVSAKDGSVMDSRDYVAGEYRLSFEGIYQELAPPIWEGTYDFEWIEVSEDLPMYGVNLGDTGEMTIIQSSTLGTYDIPNMLFSLNLGMPYHGKLIYDYPSGETKFEDSIGYAGTWLLSNINGSSIDVAYFSPMLDAYGISGKVRMTRRDGENWPTNIFTN